MTNLKALVFDVDGTLADTERDGHRVAFNRAFAEASLDWSWSESLYGKLLSVTGGKERIRYYLEHNQPNFPRPDDLTGFISKLHALKTRHYTDIVARGLIPLRPGVERLLAEARQRDIRLAIASTTTPANVKGLLDHTLGEDSMSWFDVISTGDVVANKKPAPDIFDHALEGLDLAASDCLAFEDSRPGLESSLAAGIPTIVTVSGYTRSQDFDGALLVISDLGEPQQPFTVLAGDAGGSTYVDVPLLEKLHARARKG